MTIDELKLKSSEGLKVLAYDQLLAIQNLQNSLKVVEQLIAEKSKVETPVEGQIVS